MTAFSFWWLLLWEWDIIMHLFSLMQNCFRGMLGVAYKQIAGLLIPGVGAGLVVVLLQGFATQGQGLGCSLKPGNQWLMGAEGVTGKRFE